MRTFNPDIFDGNIITSRIRLARNLKDYPFKTDRVDVAREIVKKVNRALVKCDTFNLYYVKNLSDVTLEAMKEKHLISQNLIENRDCGAVLINQDESVSVMINEEDVIREQCFEKGLRLQEVYKRLDVIDDELAKNVDIAFSDGLGYLTACPSNVGTGLRASVMLFLPALSISNKMRELMTEVSRLGLTIRGIYGEGSNSEGYVYQISNEVTLGVSEYDIIRSVEDTVEKICIAERDEMEHVFLKNQFKTMDMAKKSYGILTNAVLLNYNEFLINIANVKLGGMLGMINIVDITQIDELMTEVRPANLTVKSGKRLSKLERDLYRAEIVKKSLNKMIEK